MALKTRRLYEFGRYRVDATRHLLLHGDEEVVLPPKEFDLLLVLLESNGRVIEKDQLLDSIWPDVIVEEGTLTRTVSRLRSRLSEPDAEEQLIETVPRRGYRFLAEVRLIEEEEPALIIEEHSRTRIVVEEVKESGGQGDTATRRPGNTGTMGQGEGMTKEDILSPFVSVSPGRRVAVSPRLLVAALVAVAALSAVIYFALNRRAERSMAMLSPVPFSSLPGREDVASFSPEGNQLAFAWDGGDGGDLDIYIKLIGVGAPLRLSSDPAEEHFPVWSPDGRYIAFIRVGKTQNEVLIVPVLGGPERRLCAVDTPRSRMAWSPDGRWLAAGATPGGSNDTAIMRISVETGEKQPLTRPSSPFADSSPAFSPDGRQLVFVRTSNRTADELYLVAASGGEERKLTSGSRRINGADWTADGQEIIYSSTRAGRPSLWRVPVAGGEPEALPGAGWEVRWPAVSRRGGMLAFNERYDDTSILRLELPPPNRREGEQGSGAPAPLIVSKRVDHSPQVSPDGMKIAFVSDRSGSTEIWICDRDGGNPLQVTQMRQAEAGTPRWSPDGQRLVFDARPEQSGDLFVVNAAGGAPQRLTTEAAQDVVPSWSRDGQWIYFCSNRGGDFQLWKLPAGGGPAAQVTRQGGFEAFEAPDGNVIYSKGRGVDGLWTVPANGGEERPIPELARAGYWRAWAVTNDGIYFVAHEGTAPPRPLKFFSFVTRQVTEIGLVEKEPLQGPPTLAVSSDGRWLLYAQLDRQVSNIMLVENFR